MVLTPLISICRLAWKNISKLPQRTNPLHFQLKIQKAIPSAIVNRKTLGKTSKNFTG